MGDAADRLSEILDRHGSDTWRLKLGPGVVGITGTAVIAIMGAVGVAALALRDQPQTLIPAVEIIIGFGFLFLLGSWIFAHFHPDLALLGGADLLKFRQLQLGAQDQSILLEQPPVIGGVKAEQDRIGD